MDILDTQKSCIVPTCQSTSDAKSTHFIHFFPVPTTSYRNNWFQAVGLGEDSFGNETIYCCSNHFDFPGDIVTKGINRNKLKFDAIPHKNIPKLDAISHKNLPLIIPTFVKEFYPKKPKKMKNAIICLKDIMKDYVEPKVESTVEVNSVQNQSVSAKIKEIPVSRNVIPIMLTSSSNSFQIQNIVSLAKTSTQVPVSRDLSPVPVPKHLSPVPTPIDEGPIDLDDDGDDDDFPGVYIEAQNISEDQNDVYYEIVDSPVQSIESDDEQMENDSIIEAPAPNSIKCQCIVSKLRDSLRYNQPKYSANDYQKEICYGRLTPDLTDVSDEFQQDFSTKIYEQYTWITACPEEARLFCWPCLAFDRKSHMWTSTGVQGIKKDLLARQHSTGVNHIRACISLQKFIKENKQDNNTLSPLTILPKPNNSTTANINKEIIENRQFLKSLIEIVLHMIKMNITTRENFVQLIQLFGKYNLKLQENYKKFESLITNGIDGDIIEAIAQMIIDTTKLKIKDIKHVSIILHVNSHTNKIIVPDRLWTIIRYLDTSSNSICENLINIKSLQNINLSSHCDSIQSDFNCKEKFISLSHDMSSAIASITFLNRIKSETVYIVPATNGQSFFTHLCNSIFHQCYETRAFFTTIVELSNFFMKSSKLISVEVTGDVKAEPTDWALSGKLFQKVLTHRAHFNLLFRKIVSNSLNRDMTEWWNRDTYNTANTFLLSMDQIPFNLYLRLFGDMLPKVEALDAAIRAAKYNIKHCIQLFEHFQSDIAKQRLLFEDMWSDAFQVSSHAGKRSKLGSQKAFLHIHDIVVVELHRKYGELNDILFVDLFDNNLFSEYKKNIPISIVDIFIKSSTTNYGLMMHRELSVMYSQDDMLDAIENQGCIGVANFIRNNSLTTCFVNLYSFVLKTLTLPIWSDITDSKSAIHRISEYQKTQQSSIDWNNIAGKMQNNIDLIVVEKEIINKMLAKSQKDFYDKCIEYLIKINPHKYREFFNYVILE